MPNGAPNALIAEYEALIEKLLGALSPANHGLAVDLASLPEQVRGFWPGERGVDGTNAGEA